MQKIVNAEVQRITKETHEKAEEKLKEFDAVLSKTSDEQITSWLTMLTQTPPTLPSPNNEFFTTLANAVRTLPTRGFPS